MENQLEAMFFLYIPNKTGCLRFQCISIENSCYKDFLVPGNYLNVV